MSKIFSENFSFPVMKQFKKLKSEQTDILLLYRKDILHHKSTKPSFNEKLFWWWMKLTWERAMLLRNAPFFSSNFTIDMCPFLHDSIIITLIWRFSPKHNTKVVLFSILLSGFWPRLFSSGVFTLLCGFPFKMNEICVFYTSIALLY